MEKTELALPTFRWEPISAFDLLKVLSEDTWSDYDVYVSGAMTGLEQHNFPRFNQISDYLRTLGLRVFNPAENFNGEQGYKRSKYLRKDIKNLCRSGAILLMDDWTQSKGALLEFYVADELEFQMFHIAKDNQIYERIS